MSVLKKTFSVVLVLAIIAAGAYLLFTTGGQGRNGDEETGLGSPSVRTVVTLSVVGGSAFITGFGFRDVIGRAVDSRQRSRLRAAHQQVRR